MSKKSPEGSVAEFSSKHRLFNELVQFISETPDQFIEMLERALDGIWYWDIEDGNDEWMSPKFWTTFGFDPSSRQHLASEWQDLIFEEDLELAKLNIQRHLQAPLDPSCRYDQVVRYRSNDGTTKHIRCTGQAILNNEGKPYRVLGLHTDLTEKIEANKLKMTQEELQKLRGLSEFLPQLIWTCTKDGDCDYVSKSWSDYTGIPQQRLVGSQWFEFVHKEDQIELAKSWQKSVTSGQPFKVNFRILGKDGQYRMFDTRALALKDEKGNVLAWFGSNTDIQDSIEYQIRLEKEVAAQTEKLGEALAQAENQRIQAQLLERKAQEASEAKSRFLSSMSHELRTPLNGISGITYSLQHTSDPHKIKTLLGHLNKATQHLNSLVSDVLEMTRIEEGRIQLNIAPNSIREVCESSLAMISESATHKDIEIRYELDKELPPTVLFDDVRVKQILVNVLSNAVKFTDSGFIRLSVKLEKSSSSQVEVLFQVDDTGIGIRESRLNSIFDMFEQAEGDIFGRYGGSGLGLGLVKRLVTLMGGKVEVKSVIGEGSSFRISLPFQSSAVKYSKPDEAVQSIPDWSARHVLIVDDVDLNLMVLEGILELTGCKISKAFDGRQAIECLMANADIDLILMDIHMPNMDGLQATREIRAMDSCQRDVKVVALTGAAMEEDRRGALDVGMNDVLFKPLEPSKIYEL